MIACPPGPFPIGNLVGIRTLTTSRTSVTGTGRTGPGDVSREGDPNQKTADPRNNWLVWTGCIVGFFLWFVGLIIAIVLFRRREPRAKYVLIAAIAGALITPIALIASIGG